MAKDDSGTPRSDAERASQSDEAGARIETEPPGDARPNGTEADLESTRGQDRTPRGYQPV
jgi:hypothetical protein